MLQRHLVAVEGVDEASLQQVQDFDRAVAGATDEEVVGRVDGEAVDAGAVNCTKHIRKIIKLKGSTTGGIRGRHRTVEEVISDTRQSC